MKKTFKLLVIFIGGLTAIIVGALTGYFIIAKNKTFYIYDVRLVEPVEGMAGYIYSQVGKPAGNAEEKEEKQDEVKYVSIKNQTVYMKSQATNLYPIAVYVASSIDVDEVNITSSDKEIAKIIYKDNACFVEFLKEGFVTITSEFHGVKDSFSIQIFDQMPSMFSVYDDAYYGEYAELFPNSLITYADDEEYRYGYFLNNISNTGSNANVDGDLIRIDQEHLEKRKDIFTNVYIDSETNELVVQCKKPETIQKDNVDSTIILQSFYYAEDGSIVVENSYEVKVHVVRYIPEFLQLEISSTPDFEEKMVFTDTSKKNIDSVITEQMWQNPELITEDVVKELDKCLMAEKAENYLKTHEEKATYKAFLTDKVERLYLRARMVYTNGDIVYLENGENASITFNGSSTSDYCVLDPTGDYYIMTLNNDSNYFDVAGKTFNIEVSINGFTTPSHSFKFEYKTQSVGNVLDFYEFENGIYTYTYWDERAKFDNEIYDKDGNVVAFGV